jgi:hypothetical protein
MQTLKIIIPGNYYDSQLYSGQLYLWTLDGALAVFNWDKIVKGLIDTVSPELRFAAYCILQQSEYLYKGEMQLLLKDPEFTNLLKRRFENLSTTPFQLSEQTLERTQVGRGKYSNPFPFPHADSNIYRSYIYVASSEGINRAYCNVDETTPIARQAAKLTDLSTYSIAAAHNVLAIGAGSEGLFDYDLLGSSEPKNLITKHSSLVRWLYGSVFSSSYLEHGYLADYTIKPRQNLSKEHKNTYAEIAEDKNSSTIRELNEIIASNELLEVENSNQDSSFAWGVHDKICYATQRSLKVIKYQPSESRQSSKRFLDLGTVGQSFDFNKIIGADSAFFGYILESDDGLWVVGSSSISEDETTTLWLEGEPVRWRVFSNSLYYTNQLHVIYEDHLCINFFYNDYFSDQEIKKIGIQHSISPLRKANFQKRSQEAPTL